MKFELAVLVFISSVLSIARTEDNVTCRLTKAIPTGLVELQNLNSAQRYNLIVAGERHAPRIHLSIQQLDYAIYLAQSEDAEKYCEFTEEERNQIQQILSLQVGQ